MSTLKNILWPQVILFGDSITQYSFSSAGWGSDIANKLARKCDVVNRGLSGYNSRWGRIILPRIISADRSPNNQIAAVTVFFGANDCALEELDIHPVIGIKCAGAGKHLKPSGQRPTRTRIGDPCPMEYADNLKEMARHLGSAGVPADKVIFITPPPLNEAAWQKECELKGSALNRLNSVAGQYAKACVQAAGQCGADVLDLWTLMQKDGQDFTEFLSDGLHLSPKGNQFVAEQLWKVLERRVVDLPFILPYWGDVDPEHPEASLLCNR